VAEPRAELRKGNVPTSKNIAWNEVIDKESGTFKKKDELEKIFKDRGIDVNGEVISYCGSGLTAAIIDVCLEILGNKERSLYDGSWAEYVRI
jgi:thiosulfate/3-mercaptopyruvate sulfurtransferase